MKYCEKNLKSFYRLYVCRFYVCRFQEMLFMDQTMNDGPPFGSNYLQTFDKHESLHHGAGDPVELETEGSMA